MPAPRRPRLTRLTPLEPTSRNRFRELRLLRGWSLTTIATQLEVSNRTLSTLEHLPLLPPKWAARLAVLFEISPEDFVAPDAPDDVASSIEALAAINTRLDAANLAYAQMESRVTALTLALETARNSLPALNETRAQLLLDQHALTTAITRDITTLNTLPSAMDTLARERRNLVQQLRSANFTYQAIADLLGVTESRVKQIEKAAEREHNRAINLAAIAAKRAGTPH